MKGPNMQQKRRRLKVGCYLAGVALLMMLIQAEANTGQASAEDQTPSQSSASIPIWIQDPYTSENVLTYVGEPDTSLWNAKRITDYEETLKVNITPPLGIFTIKN